MPKTKPILLKEVNYKQRTPEEEAEYKSRLKEIMASILWDYHHNIK